MDQQPCRWACDRQSGAGKILTIAPDAVRLLGGHELAPGQHAHVFKTVRPVAGGRQRAGTQFLEQGDSGRPGAAGSRGDQGAYPQG